MPIKPMGGSGVSAHNQLTGLGADDHPQYHNNARGDARYYTQAQVDALLVNSVKMLATDSVGSTSVGTAETDLITRTLPANTLNTDGDIIRVTAFGFFANNENEKRLRIYRDSDLLFDSGAAAGKGVYKLILIFSRNTSIQLGYVFEFLGDAIYGSPNHVMFGAAADFTQGQTIKITGQGVNDGDVFFGGWVWEFLPKVA